LAASECQSERSFPQVVSDKLLTLESNLCQRLFGCAKAGGLHFLSGLPSGFPSCSCCLLIEPTLRAKAPRNGRRNAQKHQKRWSQKGDFRKLQRPQVKLMSAATGCIAALPVPAFPAAVEARWETENRTVWNELDRASEERELVYEISWIAELGIWRRFLRSNRKVQS
jgi:hypothetical protein